MLLFFSRNIAGRKVWPIWRICCDVSLTHLYFLDWSSTGSKGRNDPDRKVLSYLTSWYSQKRWARFSIP